MSDSTLVPGQKIVVTVGTKYAGTFVSAFLYSTPVNLGGWIEVAANGTIEVTIPTNTAAGTHRIAVQDASGTVIGWTTVTVSATGSGLANTGTVLAPALTMAALLLMLGGALVVSRRRRLTGEN